MENFKFVASLLVALLLGIVIGGVFSSQSKLGGLIHVSLERFVQGIEVGTTGQFAVSNAGVVTSGGVQVGTAGTALTALVATTCDLIGTDVSQAASSTAAYDCAVTGAVTGDVVLAQLRRSSAFGTNIGWTIHATKASTTADYITVILGNWSGVDAKPSVTAVGSSTQVFLAR